MSNNKQEALNDIVQIARSHGLSLQDIAESLNPTPEQQQQKSTSTAASIFSYIGGILVLGGIAVLIHMKWDSLDSVGRILLTLGPGLLAFLCGVYCTHDKRAEKAATPLFLLAAAIEPTGILIALKEYAHGHNPEQGVLFMFFVMLLQQGIVFLARQRTALAFTTILFALSFISTSFDMLGIEGRHIGLIIGFMELCIAYALGKSQHRSIAPVNYFFGSVFFLSAYGTCVYGTHIELTFLGLTSAFIYASVLVRSRALLVNGALAMLSFIGYYSAEYFSSTIGWPITLIIGGVVMIGLGIAVVKINNTYIAQRAK